MRHLARSFNSMVNQYPQQPLWVMVSSCPANGVNRFLFLWILRLSNSYIDNRRSVTLRKHIPNLDFEPGFSCRQFTDIKSEYV